MSVCSVESYASHASFASPASSHALHRRPHSRTRAEVPRRSHEAPLLSEEDMRLLTRASEQMRWREEELVTLGLIHDMKQDIDMIDECRSLQQLLHLNKDVLFAKGFTGSHFEAMEKHMADQVSWLERRRVSAENKLAVVQVDRLTELSLKVLCRTEDSHPELHTTMLDRWMHTPDMLSMMQRPFGTPIIFDGQVLASLEDTLINHDFQEIVLGGLPLLSTPMLNINIRAHNGTAHADPASGFLDACDSVHPWQPDNFQDKSVAPAPSAKESPKEVKPESTKHSHYNDVVARFMIVFERWLDATLAKYCPADSNGAPPDPGAQGGGDIAANQSNNDSQNSSTGNPKRRRDGDDSGPERNGDDGDGRAAKRVRFGTSSVQPRKLACPYFQRNREQYYRQHKGTACVGDGWALFHRLREHLYRRHALGRRCPRCHVRFQTEQSLTDHKMTPAPCQLRSQKNRDGFDSEIEARIREYKPKRGLREAEKWADIYRILFPGDDHGTIPSPYFEEGLLESLRVGNFIQGDANNTQYATYLREELPSIVRQLLQDIFNQEVSSMNDRVQQRVVAAVDSAQRIAYRRFLGESLETGASVSGSPRLSRTSIEGSSSNFERSSYSMDVNSDPGTAAAGESGDTCVTPEDVVEEKCEPVIGDEDAVDNLLDGMLHCANKTPDPSIHPQPSEFAMVLDPTLSTMAPNNPPLVTLDWVTSQVEELLPQPSFQDRTDLAGLNKNKPLPYNTSTSVDSCQFHNNSCKLQEPPYVFEFETENVFWEEFSVVAE